MAELTIFVSLGMGLAGKKDSLLVIVLPIS